jgi:hypothetical protein
MTTEGSKHGRRFAVGLLFTALAGALVMTAGMTGTARQRVAEPADLVFARAEAETALKSQVFQGMLGDEHYDWDVDLEAGVITFNGATKAVSAPVQVIGTYNTLDGTFLWGWDHPSVPEPLGAEARLAREFGRLHNLRLFTTRKVDCTEEQAWVFTAVALYLSGAQGAYRAPFGTTMVFMTFGEMTIAPIE